MDSGNHNVLQFVSAAAQALDAQEQADFYTQDALHDQPNWESPQASTTFDNDNHDGRPASIKEMLAEATGDDYLDSFHADQSLAPSRSLHDAFPPTANATAATTSTATAAATAAAPAPAPAITTTTHTDTPTTHSTAEKVQILFGLNEELIDEWPCCIVRSAIVPGYLYLMESHLCFYAMLPQHQHRKTGYLLVKTTGNLNTSFERCYFDLKDDVLAWYESATDTYSPMGKIDLKDTLTVRLSQKREHGFKIITRTKTWHLQADTKAAVIEWTNVVKKAIFKANNTGNSLKLCLPFASMIDIEQTEPFEFQQFLQIRAVGIDDSFVMDEYYFAYFADIKQTFTRLREAWESSQQELKQSTLSPTPLSESDSLSISDLYDTNAQPITIQARNTTSFQDSSDPTATIDVHDSSDDEEEAVVGWLDGKRRSGMKLVYGLLGGKNVGSAATVYRREPEEEDDELEDGFEADGDISVAKQVREGISFPHEDPIDERTLFNFKKYFVLPETETLHAVFRCSLMKTLPCYGKLYISSQHVSFNSKGFATNAKVIVPFSDILRIQKIRSRGYIFHALSILTQNKKEVFLEFSSVAKRNSCFARLFLQYKWSQEKKPNPEQEQQDMRDWEARLLEEEHTDTLGPIVPPSQMGLPVLTTTSGEPPVYKAPEKPLHFTCITIGTRGDVQPYIALCKGLQKEGHRCRIATHDEFKDWIEQHGIEFRTVGGDPSELMRICVENSFFSVHFVMEGLRLFKGWINELLDLTWKACEGTDVIIESPSAMIGIHMAEKLRVPYFRSFPMPMTRTRSFPHPFATPNNPKGKLYNDMTYVLFDHAVWRAIASRTNHFRQTVLGLPATTYEKLQVWKVPYLYSFSPSVVPSPLDWMDWIHCTGYWFLDNPQTGWKPSTALEQFLSSDDPRPLVYIGFGSIIVSDPYDITRILVEAVLAGNVRAIVSKGWSSRLKDEEHKMQALLTQHPDVILSVQDPVPHDWLFPQVRAVVHHGGAGTTAAGLRAGRPTVIKPFFADQFFWGERVEEMGLGLCIKQLTVERLANALRVVSTDEGMLKTAERVRHKILQEDGVGAAIQCIYRDIELARARTLSSSSADYAEEDQEWTLIESTASGSISPGSWRPRND